MDVTNYVSICSILISISAQIKIRSGRCIIWGYWISSTNLHCLVSHLCLKKLFLNWNVLQDVKLKIKKNAIIIYLWRIWRCFQRSHYIASNGRIINKTLWQELIGCFRSTTLSIWYDMDGTENTTSSNSSIVRCLFIVSETCLPNRCLANRRKGYTDTQSDIISLFSFFLNKKTRLMIGT
jgi:hypothetical protein